MRFHSCRDTDYRQKRIVSLSVTWNPPELQFSDIAGSIISAMDSYCVDCYNQKYLTFIHVSVYTMI